MRALVMDRIESVAELEHRLSTPGDGVVETMRHLDGDVLILGVGGKMGPTLARMVRRASDLAGTKRRVIGVSRFTSPELPDALRAHGVEPITADLLDRAALARLPEAPLLIYMAGMKFGSTGQEALTWAMNCWLPGMVCERFGRSRIAAFSTGNVYGMVPVSSGGSRETDQLNPLGDYAQSCVGRERIFEHFSRAMGIPVSIVRLNYAVELRYGVLLDIAQRVWRGDAIDLSMGYVNVIWQGEGSAMAIQSLGDAASPPFVVNVAGAEMLRVREVAERFGTIMGREARFSGVESGDALLSDGGMGWRRCGRPKVTAQEMIGVIADWVLRGGESLGKPTHFEARDGKF
jgi:nucleoside-diphosphate-sugar epimerase